MDSTIFLYLFKNSKLCEIYGSKKGKRHLIFPPPFLLLLDPGFGRISDPDITSRLRNTSDHRTSTQNGKGQPECLQAFMWTASGQNEFQSLLSSLRRTKTCKKELWSKITAAVQNAGLAPQNQQ
jgi:hypothetical protein